MGEEHLCTGPTCWTCGEPVELRDMRWAMHKALLNGNSHDLKASECSKLAGIATAAIRSDVLGMMTTVVRLQEELYLARETLRVWEEGE